MGMYFRYDADFMPFYESRFTNDVHPHEFYVYAFYLFPAPNVYAPALRFYPAGPIHHEKYHHYKWWYGVVATVCKGIPMYYATPLSEQNK